ncbi:MAG: glycosyltransferase [Desulfotomaculales bacterium]
MARKKVLVLTAYFPPVGGSGAIPTLKLVKYLGEYDCDVLVLTKEPRHNDIVDPSLLREVPPAVRVVRSRDVDPYRWLYRFRPPAPQAQAAAARPSLSGRVAAGLLRGLRSPALKILQYTAIPDDFYWWARATVPLGERIVRDEGVDVIFSNSNPYSVHLLGHRLKRRTGALWIANFYDPWTQNIHRSGIPWRERIEERMERRVMADADAVTTVTPSFAAGFRAKYGNVIKRLEVIYNGFDPDDYVDITPFPHDGRFTAAYTGLLYPKRSPRVLLEAVGELIAEGKVRRDEIVLRFAGRFATDTLAETRDCIERLALGGAVEIMGELEHQQALGVLKGADLLLLVGDTAPEAGAYIPGKLFEYMAVRRPILALVVPGEASRIIEKHALGRVVHPLDREGIKRAYLELHRAWKDGREPGGTAAGTGGAGLKIFDRRYQAAQLSRLIDELLAGRRRGAG